MQLNFIPQPPGSAAPTSTKSSNGRTKTHERHRGRTAGPDINEFLKNQKAGRVLPDVESANDGSESGLPTHAEPDAEVDPDSGE